MDEKRVLNDGGLLSEINKAYYAVEKRKRKKNGGDDYITEIQSRCPDCGRYYSALVWFIKVGRSPHYITDCPFCHFGRWIDEWIDEKEEKRITEPEEVVEE